VSDHRFYYRTTDPAVVSVVKAYFDQNKVVEEAAVKFANRFGGGAMFTAFERQLVGVTFKRDKPPKNEALWTKKDKYGMRRPLPRGGGEEGDKLRAEWKKHWPKHKVSLTPVYEAFGIRDYPFGPGIGVALRKRTVVVMATKPLKLKGLVEITASEYIKVAGKED
jgi:hypothetical protein